VKKTFLIFLIPALIFGEWIINPLPSSFYGVGNYFFISENNKTIGYRSGNHPCVASQSGSVWNISSLDTAPVNTGLEALSFKAGKNGNIHAVYEYWGYSSNTELRYSKYDGTGWTSEMIESLGSADVISIDMFIDINDVPHIVYSNSGNVYYRNRVGGVWSAAEVVTNTFAYFNYIMINSAGSVYIIYGSSSMYYTIKSGAAWSTPQLISSNVKYSFSYSKTPQQGESNGSVFACAYQTATNDDLHCVVYNGSTWIDYPVDVADEKVGTYISCVVNSSGEVTVAYNDFSFDNLKVARLAGGVWNVQTVDTAGVVGDAVSACNGNSGWPHLIYEDTTNATLKYAYWLGTTNIVTSPPPPKVSLYSNCFKPLSGEKMSIECELYQENQLKVQLYSLKGSLISTVYEGVKPEGKYTFQWDASNNSGQTVASGMYILVIQANNNKVTKKVLVVK